MHPARPYLLVLAALASPVLMSGSGPPAPAAPPTLPEVSYAKDVVPILLQRCVHCHGGEEEGGRRLEASLDLTTYEGLMAGSEYGSVVTPGDPDDSILVEMIEMGDMPDEGDPVPPEEIEVIRTWIAEGAANN